jgi:hypothetical protein
MERTLRAGQDRAKDKLQVRVEQLEAELRQQKKFTEQAEQKYLREAKEVERERAQRLMDVHKIAAAQTERDEARDVAERSVRAMDEARTNETYMHNLLEPLRMSVKQSERLAAEDGAAIAEHLAAIETLAADKRRVADQAEQQALEITVLEKRAARLQKTVSAMQADAFRMLKQQPELTSLLPSPEWGPLIKELQTRPVQQQQQRGSGSSLPRVTQGPDEAPREEDEPAWKFALFLDECKGDLEASLQPTLVERLCVKHSDGSKTAPAKDREKDKQDQSGKFCPPHFACASAGGSLFLGQGLGMRKKDATASLVPYGQSTATVGAAAVAPAVAAAR